MPADRGADRAAGRAADHTANRGALRAVPGVVLALVMALIADRLAGVIGAVVLRLQGIDPATASSPVSGILVAVVLGLLLRNTVGLPALFEPGVSFAMKPVLRLGIVLLGIRLSLLDALRIGAWGIPVVALTVVTGIAFTTWINRRLQQPDRLGTLIAASASICGVTAVVATAPAIGARDREIAYAVATVTVFGLVAMVLYPYLAFWAFGGDPVRAGLFMGTAIHETAQVAGAGLIYSQVYGQPAALDVATVTKLLRNVFLVLVVPVLALLYAARQARTSGPGARRPSLAQLFPTFVLGFLVMALLRSVGDAGLSEGGLALGFLDATRWKQFTGAVTQVASVYLLGTAMAAVGLNSSAAVLRQLGWRPMVVGLVSAAVVGIVAFGMAAVLGGRI